MTETQKRIEAYKKALPEIRERVIAVALLFAMSMAMMTSATFAWLTISRAPEVTAVNTTVAANGNLEIALATTDEAGNTNPPGESKVGDSSAAEGQSVTAANITWGNLVNLSDPSYGLDNLVLKPAQLNRSDLFGSPLYGAEYDSDGRIKRLNSDFAYTSWQIPEGSEEGRFMVENTTLGVRAISSVEVEFLTASGEQKIYMERINAANDKNKKAGDDYAALASNTGYMDSLSAMMGKYLTASLNGADSVEAFDKEDVQNLRNMYADFLLCYDLEAEAIAELINIQIDILKLTNVPQYTIENVYQYDEKTNPLPEGVVITDLKQFVKDRNTIKNDMAKLDALLESNELTYTAFEREKIIDNLVNVSICTVNGTKVSTLSADKSQAIAMVLNSSKKDVRITNGILKNFELRTGGHIKVDTMVIKAHYIIDAQIKASVRTDVSEDTVSYFEKDKNYIENEKLGSVGDIKQTARDTYGLAVDLWVRTNASGSYLTLEGNVLTKTDTVEAEGKDPNGNTIKIYTLSRTEEDESGDSPISIATTYDLYFIESEGENGEKVKTWYDAETHAIFELEKGEEPRQKMVDIVTITGYEGENRVWGDNEFLSVDSTTQGSGSCYVYYADSPEDMYRSLDLLKAMSVAFIDEEGEFLAQAKMDTEKYFAENGRIIVPLVLDPLDSVEYGTDSAGEKLYGITFLEQNVATRITAIVYLDGTQLTNDDVLAAADIQGQLNIQFGSNQSMNPIENEELKGKELKVSATVDKISFDYDKATEPMTTTVTVTVDGAEPTNVTAFFIRQINSTQGSREKEMTFTKNAEGKWIADYTFEYPGNYVLRTVRLDGVDYDLETPPEVEITGFAISSLSMSGVGVAGNSAKVFTAANSHTVDLTLEFAAGGDEDKMPETVQGRFLKDDDGSAVNVNFTYNPTTRKWNGSATFLTSGEYTMQYLVLDGKYTELAENMRKTADITLGLRVEVYTTSPHQFKYVPSEMAENQKLLAMQVTIVDNAGNEFPGLSDVKLTYNMKGSGTKTMDTDLTWDGNYYVGELTTTGPGIWQFGSVTVTAGGAINTLTVATTSPAFTILSPEPPDYYRHSTVPEQYAPKKDAVMDAQITNSAAATVQAYIIKDGAAEGTWVDGIIGGELTTNDGKPANHWSFKVPAIDADGNQDGNWTLTQLKLWNVFAADGTPYTKEDPLIIDVSEENNVTNVVNRIIVAFDPGNTDQSKVFGKDESGTVIGAFMQEYEFSDIQVRIHGYSGALEVKDVYMKYKYNGKSSEYGGYTGGDTQAGGVQAFTIDFEENNSEAETAITKSSGVGFIQKETQKVKIADKYTPTLYFTVTIGGRDYQLSYEMPEGDTKLPYTNSAGVTSFMSLPTVEVYSVVPSVAITAISPTGTFDVDATRVGEGHQSATVPSYTATNATVYFKCSRSGSGSTCDPYRHNYTRPSVTITLAGIGNAIEADLSFGDNVYIYNGTNQTTGYNWRANGTCARNIGYYRSRTAANDDKTPAGTITASTLKLTYGGKTYNVTVPTITINNPY